MGSGGMISEAKKGREWPVAVPPPVFVFSSKRSPRGREGVALIEGWGAEVRLPAGDAPAITIHHSAKFVGWREGCRRDWRAHCPAGCEGGNCSERDSGDARLNTRRCYVSLHRAAGWDGGIGGRRRGPGTGSPAPAGAGAGARVNITALVFDRGSKAKPQARRNEHRQRSRSFMPSNERSAFDFSAGADPIQFRTPWNASLPTRNAGERSEIPPVCLRRLQAAEQNAVKRQAHGRVLSSLSRSGGAAKRSECSRLKRTESGAEHLAVAVCEVGAWSRVGGPDAQGVSLTGHPSIVAGARVPAPSRAVGRRQAKPAPMLCVCNAWRRRKPWLPDRASVPS